MIVTKRGFCLIVCCLFLSSTACAGWENDELGWWWRKPNGSCPVSSWEKIRNVWYYFDASGYMVTGLQDIGGERYLFDSSGAMQTGWKQLDESDNWYFFSRNGAMIRNAWNGEYYLDEEGKMLTCTVTPDGYRVDASGRWVNYGKINRAWEEEVVRLTNEFRAENGLPPLAIDERLMEGASIRACELKTSYSHTRPNGTRCQTVAYETGINTIYGIGENIAWGYRSPKAVVEGWKKSPGHRANMLDPTYQYMGAGVYEGKYWCQLFYMGGYDNHGGW